MRLKASELAERYGEAQREIARLRDAVEARQVELSSVGEDRNSQSEALRICEANRDELLTRVRQLEEQAESAQSMHDQSMRELESLRQRESEQSAEQVARLRAEVDAAQSRLQVEEDSAGNLDNYKKRAQLALKKVTHLLKRFLTNMVYIYQHITSLYSSIAQATAANSSLQAEAEHLKAALDEANARLSEAQELHKNTQEELNVLRTRLADSL